MYASRTFVCNHEHMLATVVDNLRELDDRALTDEFRRLELERRRIDAEMAATVAGGSARANPRCGDQLVDSIDVLLEQAEQLGFDDARTGLKHGLIPFPDDLPSIDFAERRCETDTGLALLPDDIVRATLQGHVRRVVMNSAGVVIEMGRKQRLFTGAARDAAKLMATSCDHPGCAVGVTFAQVDHVTEWSDDGPGVTTPPSTRTTG